MPGSFYGRLFPKNSVNFFHSSYSLHWISKVPKGLVTEGGLNEGNICIAKKSPPSVFNEYFEQFKNDFTVFLRSRAEELVPHGSVVLTIRGSTNSHEPLSIFECLGLKINDMVLEGLIEKKNLDSFNIPYYEPTMEELMELIEAEGSFRLQDLQVFKHDWDSFIKEADSGLDKKARAGIFSTHIRSVVVPFLVSHFGEGVMEDLFRRFEKDVLDYMEKEKCQSIDMVLSLTKEY
ncbi:hypothetical protein ABKV19_022032 [Rosa sericea]